MLSRCSPTIVVAGGSELGTFEETESRLGFGLFVVFRAGFHGHVLNAVTAIGEFCGVN